MWFGLVGGLALFLWWRWGTECRLSLGAGEPGRHNRRLRHDGVVHDGERAAAIRTRAEGVLSPRVTETRGNVIDILEPFG